MIEIELPDGSIAEFPDGTSPDVIKGALQKRFGAQQEPESQASMDARGQLSAMTQNPAKAMYDQMPGWQKPLQAADDVVRTLANGMTFGFADKIAAGGDPERLAMERAMTQAAKDRSSGAGTAAEIVGNIATGSGLARQGATLAGRFGTGAMEGMKGLAARTGLMGVEGAGYGVAAALGNDYDARTGAALGALGGAAGNLLGEGLSAVASKAAQVYQKLRMTPEQRAASEVFAVAQKTGANDALAALDGLGPEAMAVDVLGGRGKALARTAANLSPDARETLNAAVLGRKSGQNARVVSDIEAAAGLPAGNRMSVGDLKSAAYDKVRGPINDAYEAARAAGYDLPRTPFQDILDSPMGAEAYDQAAIALKNRFATQGMSATSELARLDQTKRILDAKANQAFRAGDSENGQIAASMARKLRETMDTTIAGPEYATARGLRQQAFATDNAFDMGANLAAPNIPLGLPKSAGNVANKEAMAQGYGAQMAGRLLNRGSTEGALNTMSTPMAREAIAAALGGKSKTVLDALARERAFNETARAISGNSTTAQQLSDMGINGAGIVADAMTGGIGGMVKSGLRRSADALGRAVATQRQRDAAPFIAELLTRRAVPKTPPLKPTALQSLAESKREAIARMLMNAIVGRVVTP